MIRKIYYWKLRTAELQLGEKTLVMGVLNVTPDSFSDGGRFLDPDRACARALEMEEQGADIIDIGAESTRPDSKRISADEEWQRLVPVLKRLRGQLTVPISIDTYKSEVAERALEYGVEILNDPSGLTLDANLAKVAANGNAGLVLNHMRGTPETWGSLPPLPDVAGSVIRDLDATTSRARRSGVDKNRIVVDPGLGFGKRKEQNSELLSQLGRLVELDYPVLAAPSRKAFVNHPGDAGESIFGTAAAVTAAILNGAHIVRVHDVKEMRAVVLMADEIVRMSAAASKAAEEEAERAAVRPRARGPRPLPAYMGEDRHAPVSPPVLKAKPPVVTELEVTGRLEAAETPEKVKVEWIEPAAQAEEAETPAPAEPTPAEATHEPTEKTKKPLVIRRPPQDAPSKGWTPRPAESPTGDRPPRPPRRDFGDRPPRKEFGDRPPRKEFGDRPPRKEFGDRPPRKDFGDRAPRTPFSDRPAARKDFSDRAPRNNFKDKAPRKDFGDRPPRQPFSDRPAARKDFADRPPRKDFGDRPPRRDGPDRPPRSGPPGDRPFRDGPNRGGPKSGPPRGTGSGPRPPQGRPPQGRPPSGRPPQRPFRKRP